MKNMNRKVILYISMNLDGFIADKAGNVDWIEGQDKNYNSNYGYEKFIENIDTVILGYNTYRQIIEQLSPNKWVYNDFITYVFTNTKQVNKDNIKFTNESIDIVINKLKKEEGKDIWINGGANIVNQCIRKNIIDEYHITIIPVILGNGIKLFKDDNFKIKLRLKEIKEENGLIESIYEKR